MKKLCSVVLAVLLVAVLAVGVCAEGIRDTQIITNAGHYLVIKTDKAAEVFAAGSIFNWGLTDYLEPYDEGVKIKAGVDLPAGGGVDLSVAYGNTIGIEVEPGTFVTSVLKYYTITYKSESSWIMALKFAPVEADWGVEWNTTVNYFAIELPASSDYTTAVVPLASNVLYDATPFLMGWEIEKAPSDVYVKDMGFFASEDEAKSYFNIQPPVTEAPVTEAPVTDAPVTDAPVTDAPVTDAPVTDTPAPDTSDIMGISAVALAVAAICTAVVIGKRK